MPISKSLVKMIHSMDKQYPSGKMKCYDVEGGGQVCAHSRAWSVFYAYMQKHGKDETKGLSEDEVIIITPDMEKTSDSIDELSDADLAMKHIESHVNFVKIGDQACKDHFAIANEMIDRGMAHANRSKCDVVVALARDMDPDVSADETDMLLTKWKACKAMMFRLSKMGLPFESGVFKGLNIDEQKSIVKNLARKIRRSMAAKGMRPKKKSKPC